MKKLVCNRCGLKLEGWSNIVCLPLKVKEPGKQHVERVTL